MRDLVLIVDDIDINRLILRNILEEDYDIEEASNGQETLDLLFDKKIKPAAILLDIIMPVMDGFAVLEKLKANESTAKIPVLFITAADARSNETRGLEAGAADYVSKPFNADVVKTRLANHIRLRQYQTNLENMIAIKTAEVTKTYEQTLEVLATIIEYRNLESGAHIRRTLELMDVMIDAILASEKHKKMLEGENHHSMRRASALHDIGKIGIADSILLKPGKLTYEEFEIMKTHATIGGDIIDSISKTLKDNDLYLKYCKDICLYHHERWDGSGYPQGLSGERIPVAARIIAVVDVYDALVSIRCYKPAFSHEQAIEIINDGCGSHFDPAVVEIFLQITDQIREIVDNNQD